MSQDRQPQILAHVRRDDGLAFQLRRDPAGTLDVPALDMTLLSIHIGPAARISCRRANKSFTGTAVHGDMDIIPCHTPARWVMHDENDMALLLAIPQATLFRVAEECGLNPTRGELLNRFAFRDPELENLCWAIKRELEAGSPSGRFYLDGLALATASRLISHHSTAAKRFKPRNEGLQGHRLKQVLAFIEEQLADDLSLDDLAAVAGVSASHMKTLFRRSMGVPVHQYIIERRIERAKSLMAQDHLSMAQIAATAGFAHQSHMARHMRRVTGMAPKAMRRMLAEMPAHISGTTSLSF